jgi:hypothetical protein
MVQPAHLLASRRHAEKAISSGGGNNPAVHGRLAQTAALCSVAAATGRLAGALSHPGGLPRQRRRPPVTRSPGSVSSTPNACMPWTAEADAALLAACQGRPRHAHAR